MKKLVSLMIILTLAFAALPANAVVEVEHVNVGLNKPITTISGGTQYGDMKNIVDGDPETYWESIAEGYQFICIDLGKAYRLDKMVFTVPSEVRDHSAGYFTVILSNNPNTGHNPDIEPVPIANHVAEPDVPYELDIVLDPQFPETYRYVKIQNITGTSFGFSELEIWADEEKLDLLDVAQGKTVTMNAGATQEGTPDALVDGDPETYWMAQGTFTVLEIDLGREYEITQIQVNIPQAVLDISAGSYIIGVSNTAGGQDTDWNEARLDPASGEFTHSISLTEKYRYVKFMTYSGLVYGFSDVKVLVKEPYFKNMQALKGGETVTSLADGVDEVSVDIVDNRDVAESFTLLAVRYDAQGRMVACRAAESVPERGLSTFSMDLSDWQFAQGDSICIALLSNLVDMHLYYPLYRLGETAG